MKWNPYPKKQPPKRQKRYLVTARTESRHLIVVSSSYYKAREIRDIDGFIVKNAGWIFDDDVVAWAELPDPYKKKK